MKTQTITMSASGPTSSAEIDLQRVRNGVGLLCTVSSGGSVSYSVQLSIDNSNWNDHDSLATQTTSQNGNLSFPVRYVRLNGTITSGTVTLGICQAS